MDIHERGVDDARSAVVKKNGNGAHITVPKEWLDRTVIVLLKEQPHG